MTKIKLNWAYAKGELDTDTLKLICLHQHEANAYLVRMNWMRNFV